MSDTLKLILAGLISYLLGSVNPSIIVTKIVKKKDIRTLGSGNAGMSNTLRVLGPRAAAVVISFDILKTCAAALIGKSVGGHTGFMICGACVMLGHVFPLFFGFRGGKSVVCSATLLGFFDYRVLLICLGTFLIVALLTRKISPGSLAGECMAPIFLAIFRHPLCDIIYYICVCLFVFFLHRDNIKRLIKGNENGATYDPSDSAEDKK